MYFIIMQYIILFVFIILLIYFLKKNISSNFIVPYTIKDHSIDFIHYGYFTNNMDLSKKSDNIFYNAQLNLIKELIKNIKINKNDYILDVGCGVGGFIKYLNANYSNLNIRLNYQIKILHMVMDKYHMTYKKKLGS